LLLPAAAFLAFTSCNDTPDFPEIAVSSFTIYVEQKSDTEFVPYIGFEYSGDEALDHGEIKKDGVPMTEIMTNKDLQFCQIDPQKYIESELTAFNGEYTLNPIGVKGNDWEFVYDVSFDKTELLKDVDVTEFGYKNGKLYATFTKTGAAGYGFFIQACDQNGVANPYYSMVNDYYRVPLNMFLLVPASDAAVLTQSVESSLNIQAFAMQGISKVKITPVAVNYGTGARLVRENEYSGVLAGSDTEKVFYTTQEQEEA
jgi:hypothetical protein